MPDNESLVRFKISHFVYPLWQNKPREVQRVSIRGHPLVPKKVLLKNTPLFERDIKTKKSILLKHTFLENLF